MHIHMIVNMINKMIVFVTVMAASDDDNDGKWSLTILCSWAVFTAVAIYFLIVGAQK